MATELPQAPTYEGHTDMQEVRREAHEDKNVVPSVEHFHTDSPFLPRPPLCVVMRALAVPRYGGDTAFSNAYLVYEDLSEGLRKLLDGLQVVYSGKDIWSKNAKLDPDKRLRLRESHSLTEAELESIHPAVRRHPATGRKALYATTAYFKRFVGWSEDESRALLNYLQGLAQRADGSDAGPVAGSNRRLRARRICALETRHQAFRRRRMMSFLLQPGSES